MWFKQVQLFHLTTPIKFSVNAIIEKLDAFAFKPCLPSMPSSTGWVSPLDEDEAPLTRGINGCVMICLQIEEKILPASVIGYTLKEKLKQIELNEARKVGKKEKLSLKDEVTFTLLPRAFSKISQIKAYIDTRNNWLVLNSISPKKTELFISMFKKTFGDGICSLDIIKPSSIVTTWLKSQDYPTEFSIEKSCVLQDPNQQNRVIRCQQQDLFAASIQSLVKDGCDVIQLGLCWHDRINFVLADDLSVRSVRLAEEDLAEIKEIAENKQQRFDADLIMMSEMLTGLFNDLLKVFQKRQESEQSKKLAIAV